MNKTISLKIILIFSFLGFYSIINAQENFTNSVTISEELNGYNWPTLEVHGFGGSIDDHNAHPVINLVRKNGTINAPSFTKNGDVIGVLGFAGFDGTNIVHNVRISAYALSDYTNSTYANRLDFQVGGNATCCGQTRMSINGVTGNVGIGTTEPDGKLDINFGGFGNIPRVVFKSVNENPGINFYRPTGSAATAYPWRIEENLGALEFQTGVYANIGSESLRSALSIDQYNVEIGKGNNQVGQRSSLQISSFDANAKFYGTIHSNWEEDQRTFDIYTNDQVSQLKIDASSNPYGKILLLPGANANVGIGTLNPDSKLTVKGSIHAEEVKVDLNIAPDYVFEKYYDGFSALKNEYRMLTLQEVEAYTKENKHLPEVPSAQEIKENGLKLGEMNAILLQKVEELTLYLIEQNKEIEKLKTKVDELSKK